MRRKTVYNRLQIASSYSAKNLMFHFGQPYWNLSIITLQMLLHLIVVFVDIPEVKDTLYASKDTEFMHACNDVLPKTNQCFYNRDNGKCIFSEIQLLLVSSSKLSRASKRKLWVLGPHSDEPILLAIKPMQPGLLLDIRAALQSGPMHISAMEISKPLRNRF